jgi:photosystem II stability/assembly factor-like uncharacterized protein
MSGKRKVILFLIAILAITYSCRKEQVESREEPIETQVEPVGYQAEGFYATFDDQNLSGWECSETTHVVEGALQLEPGAFASLPGDWNDYRLKIRFRFENKGKFITEFRVSDEGSYILEYSTDELVLKRRVGMEMPILGQKELSAGTLPVNEITIEVVGGKQRIWLNNTLMLEVNESDPQSSGGILLRTEGQLLAEVLEISVQPLSMTEMADMEPQIVQPTKDLEHTMPAYQAEPWLRMGGPPGGLGYDIRMRPDSPDIMFVTDANAGIHKSVDGGKTWEAKNEGIGLFLTGGAPVFCATIDPHDYDTIWIGMQGIGHVYISTNNGESWQPRDNGIDPEGRSIRGITIDPNDPNVVYVGLEVSSFVWNGEQIIKRFDLTQGEVYKSIDRGETWRRIWVGDNLARYVWVDPRNSKRLYVSTGIFDRDAANSDVPGGVWGGVGILRSDDGGQTWEVLDESNGLGGRYVPSLFMHPEDPDLLLAAITNSTEVPGAYVTRNGGDSWELVLKPPPGFGMEAVEIAESNPDIWYAASESRIWRSDDAGRNWEQFEMRVGNHLAGLPIDLQVDPRDPMRIFVNNYGGGNFVSEDGGKTWSDASEGYTGIGDLENVTVSPFNTSVVFARNFVSRDAGHTWTSFDFDFKGSVLIPGVNSEDATYLVGDGTGHVRQSSDGGFTWSEPYNVVDIQAGLKNGTFDLEAYPMRAMDNSNANPMVIYAGFTRSRCMARIWYECLNITPGFFRSEDGGISWRHIQIPPGDISVLGIAVDELDSEHILIGTGNGLFESRDGGQNWERNLALDELTGNIYIHPELSQLGMETSMILDVRLDPFDRQVIYVSSTPGGVYRSQDGGASWMHVPAGMDPNEIVHTLLPDPNRKGVIYASTAFSGVFVTEDGANSWRQLKNGLTFTNTRGISLSSDGSVLYAGAEGGGVFRLGEP